MLPALETPIEDVIPGSRSFNYFIPIVRLPGRNGLDLDLTLYYNNRVWALSSDLADIIIQRRL